MNTYEAIILNLILIYFPILVNFFYKMSSYSINKKVEDTYLDIAIITSFYLVFRFYKISNLDIALFYLNIPLLISYLNKKNKLSIVLSTILISCNYTYFAIPIYVGLIIYTSYYLLFNINKISLKASTNLFALMNIFILNITFYLNHYLNYQFYDIYTALLLSISLYIYVSFSKIIYKQGTRVLNFHKSLHDLEREKQLRMSLFQITHEIKNPITVCKGYLDMFDTKNLEHSKKYIPIIKNEIKRVLFLIEDFLSVTKVKINKEWMDVAMLLEENEHNFMPLFKEKNINYHFDIVYDEVYIMGDYNRLNQVMINLLKNSVEAMGENNNLNVSLKLGRDDIKIIVEDDGKGMSDEELNKISQPFFTTKTSGTGLGLYLCNEIVKAHHGNIRYDSKVGVGTKAIVTLPYKKDVNFS